VVRLSDRHGRAVAVVKMVDRTAGHLVAELAAETDRLHWLAGLGVPVPEVLGTGADEDGCWLATRALPGRPASDPRPAETRDAVVDLLAASTRALHATVVTGRGAGGAGGADRSVSAVLPEVRARVASGLVDRSWAIAGRQGPPAAAVLTDLERLAGDLGDGERAVTHGDLCLPNVLVDQARTTGFVDVGRAGLAEPHTDVADMVRSLRSHLNPQFGPEHAERFLDAYGRDRVDPARLRLHDLLESFFWPVREGRST
jgi:aminoglycoside phosphotransferase